MVWVNWRWRFCNFPYHISGLFWGHIVGMEGCLVQKDRWFRFLVTCLYIRDEWALAVHCFSSSLVR